MTKYKYFGKLMQLASKYSSDRKRSLGEWLKVMSKDEINWCVKHNFMKQLESIENPYESSHIKYYELTNLGNRLYAWYVYDTWTYIKYVIHKIFRF